MQSYISRVGRWPLALTLIVVAAACADDSLTTAPRATRPSRDALNGNVILVTNASGANVQAEYIRDGQELMVGAFGNTVDAGWKMGADVPLYENVRNSPAIERVMVRGQSKSLPKNPSLGTLSSGGLY